ncbi:glycoside hydrolase family 2 TIM barrel-domain containing protein [Ligaoa zhengdingensis]|uniref:glycoside hydrolase family 2 TIM barrel-domain containing protein n=1 Tax=Ligaoa zhengdingensis TaxID=2763658 RepID=UPI0031B9C508
MKKRTFKTVLAILLAAQLTLSSGIVAFGETTPPSAVGGESLQTEVALTQGDGEETPAESAQPYLLQGEASTDSILLSEEQAEVYLPQSEMKASASSWAEGEDPEKAIDGDAVPPSNPAVKTVWCVDWNDPSISSPQWFEVDLGENRPVKAFELSGRTNGTTGGMITKYDLLVKADGAEEYTEAILDGAFEPQDTDTPVRADLSETAEVRYLRIVAKEIAPYSGGDADKFWPAISNFNVIVAASPEEPDPEQPLPKHEWSDDWATPEIPPEADHVAGVAEPVISLDETTGDGTWKFLFDVPDERPGEKADFDFTAWGSENWQNIKVPGGLVMQGHDILNEVEYYYQTQVTIPEDYAGKRVLLRFNGVYSYARVWVDGAYLRDHSGGFTTWDCDITDKVTAGETVTVTVGITDKLNNPSIGSNYAHHNMGGINREVQLLAFDQQYIKRLYVETELDDAFVDAELMLTTEVKKPAGTEAALKFVLSDGDDVVLEERMDVAGDKAIEKITIPVAAPKLWDAEHPNLYTLTATLEVDGQEIQTNSQKVGFREITFGGADGTNKNMVYVNGKQVKLRGTCRHDVSYDLGRSTTPKQSWYEVATFKEMNINFIRTSHYPPNKALIEACDELGVYLLEETAVCFQGPDGKPPKTTEADYLDQFTEMIERDRNHPSILIWSLGNESFGNWTPAFQTEARYIADVDTTRPTMFSYPWTSGAPYTDIYSTHYAPWNGDYQGWAPYGGIPRDLDRPLLHDEYAHVACYNRDELTRDVNVRNFWGESIKRFWERLFVTDGELGGALWGGIDDVFYIPEGTTERHQSHSDGSATGYGEWGSVLDAYMRLKPEAYLVKKAYSPIRLDDENVGVPGNGSLSLEIKNWFDHTNLDEVRLVYTVNGDEEQTVEQLAPLEPHAIGELVLPERDWALGDTINLKFYTADGIMVDEYNVTLGNPVVKFAEDGDAAPTLTEEDGAVAVEGENFTVEFDQKTARLTQAKFKDEVLLTGGPHLNVVGLPLGEWNPAEESACSAQIVGNQAVVTLNGSFGVQGVRFVITISGNGRIETQYTLTTAPSKTSGFSEIGVGYDLRSDVKSVDWLRDGLWSAYPEDHIGRNRGEALRVRPGSDETPDQYGVKPNWGWEQDMRNFFLYTKDSEEDGISTNDFRTMREYFWYYNANFEGTQAKVQVESQAKDAARIAMGYSKPHTVDNADLDQITYTGSGWGHSPGSGFYNETQSYSQQAGDACTFTFEGTGVKFISSYQKNTGKAKVRIDGGDPTEIDLYNGIGTAQKQYVAYQAEGLAPGKHTIEIEVVGGEGDSGFVLIDAFQVLRGESSQLEATLYVNNEWNYPALDWKNYTKPTLRLSNGYTGTVTLRLTDTDDYQEVVEGPPPVAKNVQISKQGNALTVDYTIENGTEAKSSYRWLQKKAGDLVGIFVAIPGAVSDTLPLSAELAGMEIICEVTPGNEEQTGVSVQSGSIAVGAEIVDDADTGRIVYTSETDGAVIHDAEGYLSDENVHESTLSYVKQGKVSFTFTGTGIRWMGHRESNHGQSKVSVDGVELATVDQSTSGEVSYNTQILFEKLDLNPGEHTITIENVGSAYLSVDAFVVVDHSALIDETPSDVDKTALKALIAAVEGKYDENRYTAASWKALTDALNAAKAVVADAAATESQVFDAYLALVAARDGLSYAPDKSLLTLAVEIAEDLLKDESLTAATKEALQAAVNSAKAVLDNADATQAEINAEYAALMTRITELVKADKTLLRQLIAAADALEEGNYRPSSWANLQAVLTEAKAVEANGNATEAMIAEACSKLTAAINALQSEFNYAAINAAIKLAKEILADSKYDEASKAGLAELVAEAEALCESDEATQKGLDDMAAELTRAIAKVRLMQAVAEVNGLNAARYTAASWNAVQAAQAEAKALLANENATEEELTGAATKLANAVKGLKTKSGSSGSVSKVNDNDYWNGIIEKINGTEKGGIVNATLESGAMTLAAVIDAAAAKGVKLNIEIGGKAYLLSNYAIDASAVYYSAAELIAMADGKAPAAGDAAGSGNANPETGGEAGTTVAPTIGSAAVPAPEAPAVIAPEAPAEAAETEMNSVSLWVIVAVAIAAVAAIGGAIYCSHRKRRNS